LKFIIELMYDSLNISAQTNFSCDICTKFIRSNVKLNKLCVWRITRWKAEMKKVGETSGLQPRTPGPYVIPPVDFAFDEVEKKMDGQTS